MEDQNSPQIAGFIFVRHIRACGMCSIKARRYFLDQGWTNQQIKEFFDNGMQIEQFKALFGHDAMAQQVIEKAEKDG